MKRMNMKGRQRDTDRGETRVLREKPVPLPLSTTNPTWAGLRSKLGHHRDRLVTNIRHIIIAYHCDYSVEYMVRNQLTI
jgi:hypothetical protein